MKNIIIKNIHILIILYAANNLYMLYTEKDEALVQVVSLTPSLEVKVGREKKKLRRIEEFKKNLEQTKKRVREVVSEIEKAQKQLPEDVNDAVAQEKLNTLATKLKIKSISQVPGNETGKGFYFAKEYNLKGVGTYLQGLILLENIEKSERILNIKSYHIKNSEISNRSRFPVLDMNIVLESYRYNKQHREKSGVEEIESKFKTN